MEKITQEKEFACLRSIDELISTASTHQPAHAQGFVDMKADDQCAHRPQKWLLALAKTLHAVQAVGTEYWYGR
jgi:hypothetical protein